MPAKRLDGKKVWSWMNDQNPFQSPVQESLSKDGHTAHRIVSAWERLRLLYNVLLGVPGICLATAAVLSKPESALETIAFSILFAGFANLCFCAGPGFELYLCYFRKIAECPPARLPLFILGTLLSFAPIVAGSLAVAFGRL